MHSYHYFYIFFSYLFDKGLRGMKVRKSPLRSYTPNYDHLMEKITESNYVEIKIKCCKTY